MTVADQDLVRDELARLLASPDFDASERNRRFLCFVVEETLAGREDRIKAYSIATAAFGRGEDFDPQQDSIVRIEAARLRRALEHFYLKQGDPGGIRISIPKGTYVPEFAATQLPSLAIPPAPTVSAGAGQPLRRLLPRILVENFDQYGQCALCPGIGRTLTRQVIAALTRFTELFVYGVDDETGPNGGPARVAHGLDYRLCGTVVIAPDALRLDLMLRDARDGRYLWAQDIARPLDSTIDPARIVNLGAEIARHVAQVLALRDGILDSQIREMGDQPIQSMSGYRKLLEFHDYWRSLDPALFQPLRRNLEAAIAEDPRFTTALTCLSLLYADAARYGYDVSDICTAPLTRAQELAQRAIQLAPQSSAAHHARAVAEWFSGQPEASLASLQIARRLNPGDPKLLAELGFRHAMRMEWDRAIPLIEESYARNPVQPGQYRMGLFFHHFVQGRFDRALREVEAINAPGIAHVHLAAAAALVRLGRRSEAHARLGKALTLSPSLLARLRQDLSFRQIHPVLIAAIMTAIDDITPDAWHRIGA